MPSFLAKLFVDAVKLILQSAVIAQLAIIKKNNSPAFYKEVVQTGSHFFNLLSEATENKTVEKAIEIFKPPLETAAEADGI